jgi:hypothetical protein
MKDLDLATLLAVLHEMLGAMLWVGLAAAALFTLAFVVVLVRDRGLRPRRLVWSELLGLAGGALAVLVMQAVTSSGFADLGGPVDWLLALGIFVLGTLGTAVATYAVLGLGRRLA